MGLLKKRIILKNNEDLNNGMAVVTIEKDSNGVFGNIKIYNICESDLILGISNNKSEVLKKSLTGNNNSFNFNLPTNFDINGNISCVIVKKRHDNVNALVWGSNNSNAFYKEEIINSFNENKYLKNEISFKSVEVYENNKNLKMETNTVCADKDETDNSVVLNQTKTPHAELFETSEEELENIIDDEMDENEMIGDFYSLIKEQIDELFDKFPADERLEKVIPDSKWVRVNYENNNNEYVVGLVYEGQTVKYICYGVPSTYSKTLPPEIEDFSQWLPLDENKPYDQGFYLMFQDAKTGDSVQLFNNAV